MSTLVTFEPYGTVPLSAFALIFVAGSIGMYWLWLVRRNRRRRVDWDVEMVEAGEGRRRKGSVVMMVPVLEEFLLMDGGNGVGINGIGAVSLYLPVMRI
ncbi:hypothetical protein IW261DRAFT_1572323 [Armillaria novae-zelandiae]|uniref:Uncharacterized protein n=1 Tax=Armillaria novae-zelandiae TaxID=153914 RepID=A0AA39NSN4_9AGAR|nr:hypothetical protein IW261DRAFT_1572323 [Armillaria novae-zelandiae]